MCLDISVCKADDAAALSSIALDFIGDWIIHIGLLENIINNVGN